MRARMVITTYYIAVSLIVIFSGIVIVKLMFWPPCTPNGPSDTTCIVDGWSVAGLAGTVLGVSATVLALLGAFAVAAWWTGLDKRVSDEVAKLYKEQVELYKKESNSQVTMILADFQTKSDTQLNTFHIELQTKLDAQVKVAIAEFQTRSDNTQQALVYLGLGDRYANKKYMRQAVAAYKKAGSFLPNDPQMNYVLGQIYSGFGYYEEAISSFDAALAHNPQYPEAEMALGLAYRRRGQYRRGPDADTIRVQDYEKAIEHLQHAIDLRPNYDDALSTLGGLYRRRGEYEKALEYYESAYQVNPHSSYLLGNVASLCWYLGKQDKARQYYTLTEEAARDHALKTHAEIYWDYYDLGLAQLVLGKTEEAKKSYAKAISETSGAFQFDSVLSVLRLLQKSHDPIPGIDEVIQTIEKEKSTRER